MIGITDLGDGEHIPARAVLADIHASKQFRLDSEYNMRGEWLADTDASSQPILPVFQESIRTELDRVPGQSPFAVPEIGRILFDLGRLHWAVVRVEFGQNIFCQLWTELDHATIG